MFMTRVRKYRIICLKRSEWMQKKKDDYISDWYNNADLVFWRPNCAGYTTDAGEAGLYTADELERCGGSFGDWLLEPVWCEV